MPLRAQDGPCHAVDSSELALLRGVILKPIMNVEVDAPVEFHSENGHLYIVPFLIVVNLFVD